MNDITLKEWQIYHENLWLSIAEYILVYGKTECIAGLKIDMLRDLGMIELVVPGTWCFLCAHAKGGCESCWLERINYSCRVIYNEFDNFNQRQQVIAAIRIATVILATEHNYTLRQCYARACLKMKADLMCDFKALKKAVLFEKLLLDYGLMKRSVYFSI